MANSSPATPPAVFTSGFAVEARVIGTHGVVEMAIEHEANFVWADLVSVGAFDDALAHLQQQLLGVQLVEGTGAPGQEVGSEHDIALHVEGHATLQQQLHAAQAAVHLAQATAAHEDGANAWGHCRHF